MWLHFLIKGNTAGLGDTIVSVNLNHELKYALLEMRTVEEASNAMALGKIIFEVHIPIFG